MLGSTEPRAFEAPVGAVWTTRVNLLTGRTHLAVAAASNGKVYAIGGMTPPPYNMTIVATAEEYDPVANAWASLPDMPSPRWLLAAVGGPDGKVYAIGGYGPPVGTQATVERYDPATNTWTRCADMPTGRSQLAVAQASNGRIYAVGGCCGSSDGVSYGLATVEEYDPISDTWRSRASMPTPRYDLALVAASNGKLYAIGGVLDAYSHLDNVEEYDPERDAWSARASMPSRAYGMAAIAADTGSIYVFGGTFETIGDDTLLEYIPASNAWRKLASIPHVQREFGAALATNGKAYAIGGNSNYPQGQYQLNREASFLDKHVALPLISSSAGNYADDFSDPNTGWPTSDDPIASRGYVSGEYRILVKQSDYVVRAGRDMLATDFAMEVDCRAFGHADGSCGFYFGSSDTGYYLFDVGYGQFRVLRYDRLSSRWTALVSPTLHLAIRTGVEGNRLRVTRSGSTITLYANGQLIGQASDSTFGEGFVGLAAVAAAANYDARFDNFVFSVFPGTSSVDEQSPAGARDAQSQRSKNGREWSEFVDSVPGLWP